MTEKINVKKLSYAPLSPETLADFEQLFGSNGACGGCWCMNWLIGKKKFNEGKGNTNRNRMRRLVRSGKEPGLLAYYDSEPIGWIAAAPRQEYDYLRRSRVLKQVDDQPVWSVSCLFIRKDCREQGVSVQLLKAVKKFVKERGGNLVEGYPYEPSQKLPGAFVWTGLSSAYLKAGYKEAARFSESRPIYRARV
ncbi:MAG: GNAT family N-acetyltransferase [Ignavibacteriaceae bacterium]|nr:GNAT family N-acetyltransferase [Ignavibacteriaceae bacterium]